MVTQINDMQLIKLVRSHPILYDKNLARKPGSSSLKDEIWRKLSQQMKCSERACITRWKSLRDRFGKELRKAQEKPEETVNWDMFEHLIFLREHYKYGSAFVNIKYEPKNIKRGRKRLKQHDNDMSNQECENGDVDAEELLQNQQLIELVREHPVLYDRIKIRDSKNLTVKNDAWRKISESVGITEELCYKRWKKLRERFARECRQKKLYPERPITWIYFQDLAFLEEHYRKGVPLPVDDIKQKKKAKTVPTKVNDTMEEDCSLLYVKDERGDIDLENIDTEFIELNTSSLDELITIQNNDDSHDGASNDGLQNIPLNTSASQDIIQNILENRAEEPEGKLTALITGIKHVLDQSKDCLKSLQKQNEEHKHELQSTAFASFNSQANMLQKVHILLDGLNGSQRALAERRIVQFLCECQIKTLNNDDIEDVSPTQFL